MVHNCYVLCHRFYFGDDKAKTSLEFRKRLINIFLVHEAKNESIKEVELESIDHMPTIIPDKKSRLCSYCVQTGVKSRTRYQCNACYNRKENKIENSIENSKKLVSDSIYSTISIINEIILLILQSTTRIKNVEFKINDQLWKNRKSLMLDNFNKLDEFLNNPSPENEDTIEKTLNTIDNDISSFLISNTPKNNEKIYNQMQINKALTESYKKDGHNIKELKENYETLKKLYEEGNDSFYSELENFETLKNDFAETIKWSSNPQEYKFNEKGLETSKKTLESIKPLLDCIINKSNKIEAQALIDSIEYAQHSIQKPILMISKNENDEKAQMLISKHAIKINVDLNKLKDLVTQDMTSNLLTIQDNLPKLDIKKMDECLTDAEERHKIFDDSKNESSKMWKMANLITAQMILSNNDDWKKFNQTASRLNAITPTLVASASLYSDNSLKGYDTKMQKEQLSLIQQQFEEQQSSLKSIAIDQCSMDGLVDAAENRAKADLKELTYLMDTKCPLPVLSDKIDKNIINLETLQNLFTKKLDDPIIDSNEKTYLIEMNDKNNNLLDKLKSVRETIKDSKNEEKFYKDNENIIHQSNDIIKDMNKNQSFYDEKVNVDDVNKYMDACDKLVHETEKYRNDEDVLEAPIKLCNALQKMNNMKNDKKLNRLLEDIVGVTNNLKKSLEKDNKAEIATNVTILKNKLKYMQDVIKNEKMKEIEKNLDIPIVPKMVETESKENNLQDLLDQFDDENKKLTDDLHKLKLYSKVAKSDTNDVDMKLANLDSGRVKVVNSIKQYRKNPSKENLQNLKQLQQDADKEYTASADSLQMDIIKNENLNDVISKKIEKMNALLSDTVMNLNSQNLSKADIIQKSGILESQIKTFSNLAKLQISKADKKSGIDFVNLCEELENLEQYSEKLKILHNNTDTNDLEASKKNMNNLCSKISKSLLKAKEILEPKNEEKIKKLNQQYKAAIKWAYNPTTMDAKEGYNNIKQVLEHISDKNVKLDKSIENSDELQQISDKIEELAFELNEACLSKNEKNIEDCSIKLQHSLEKLSEIKSEYKLNILASNLADLNIMNCAAVLSNLAENSDKFLKKLNNANMLCNKMATLEALDNVDNALKVTEDQMNIKKLSDIMNRALLISKKNNDSDINSKNNAVLKKADEFLKTYLDNAVNNLQSTVSPELLFKKMKSNVAETVKRSSIELDNDYNYEEDIDYNVLSDIHFNNKITNNLAKKLRDKTNDDQIKKEFDNEIDETDKIISDWDAIFNQTDIPKNKTKSMFKQAKFLMGQFENIEMVKLTPDATVRLYFNVKKIDLKKINDNYLNFNTLIDKPISELKNVKSQDIKLSATKMINEIPKLKYPDDYDFIPKIKPILIEMEENSNNIVQNMSSNSINEKEKTIAIKDSQNKLKDNIEKINIVIKDDMLDKILTEYDMVDESNVQSISEIKEQSEKVKKISNYISKAVSMQDLPKSLEIIKKREDLELCTAKLIKAKNEMNAEINSSPQIKEDLVNMQKDCKEKATVLRNAIFSVPKKEDLSINSINKLQNNVKLLNNKWDMDNLQSQNVLNDIKRANNDLTKYYNVTQYSEPEKAKKLKLLLDLKSEGKDMETAVKTKMDAGVDVLNKSACEEIKKVYNKIEDNLETINEIDKAIKVIDDSKGDKIILNAAKEIQSETLRINKKNKINKIKEPAMNIILNAGANIANFTAEIGYSVQ
ncbi:hypothetical protein A3Q56_06063 [Intoshia linei]|uniref:Uncharacterized protein n=1 Tax=Intoshia linei TaxID=1819745 RepID=A0A177AVZ9_9BILA|nr:hypothetical protein A3Q56_06063 [Intoshia linei]